MSQHILWMKNMVFSVANRSPLE